MPSVCRARRAKFSPIFPQFSHPKRGMTQIHPWGPPYGASTCLFPFYRHHNMFPAHSILHYTRSTGALVSFVLRVLGLEEGVIFGGKALE